MYYFEKYDVFQAYLPKIDKLPIMIKAYLPEIDKFGKSMSLGQNGKTPYICHISFIK